MNSEPWRVKTVTRACAGHCPLSQYSFIRNLRELPFLDSSSGPPGPSEDISELADVDGRQRCHPPYGRDGAIPQIGGRLSISRRTVQTHVAHTFMKLGVSSRAQLAAEVTRQPSRG
jgi:hypothetical protein